MSVQDRIGQSLILAPYATVLLLTVIGEGIVKENRFQLYYQAINPIEESNEGEHLEILIRMLDESGKVILPSSFLAAAEHYYISPQLDRWVIQNTAEWFAHNPDKLQRLSMCSINLSGRSLGDEEVLGFITQVFDNYPNIAPQ